MFSRRRFFQVPIATAILADAGQAAAANVIVPDAEKFESPPLGDYTDALNAALDLKARNGGGILRLGPGNYNLKQLVLHSGVTLAGAGRGATNLFAMQSDNEALIVMDQGPVMNAGLRDLTVSGGNKAVANPNQWAMKFSGQPSLKGKPHGGLWWSAFENISVVNFTNGMWFAGGEDNSLLPHQFVSLRNVVMYAAPKVGNIGLKMTGQVNQFDFLQLHIDSFISAGVSIEEGQSKKNAPKLHKFLLTTIQNSNLAMSIKGAHNVSVDSCWFENDSLGVLVSERSYGINLTGNRFANTGSNAAVQFDANSSGMCSHNVFAGPGTHRSVMNAAGDAVSVSANSIIWGAVE